MEWYLSRNQQQYGPYTGEQLAGMQQEGTLLQNDLFSKQGEAWITLEQASALFVAENIELPQRTPDNGFNAYQAQPQPAHAYAVVNPQPQFAYPDNQGKQKKKGKKGCLGCLTALILGFAVLFGSAYLFLNRNSGNLSLERQEQLATESVTVAGGTIDFTMDDGKATLAVPEGAYEKTLKFKVSSRDIKEHKLGENFNPITPLITIDNKHAFSAAPMLLTIPIQIADDEFAMAFYYDLKSGELEGIPMVALTNTSITIATHHFSGFLVSKIKTDALKDIDIETGFEPGYDDWQFGNYGSWLARTGHCAGQSISALWYYDAIHRQKNERKLYGRYDNYGQGMGTIDFWQDDSRGYRFASVIQRKINWGNISAQTLEDLRKLGDRFTHNAFAYSMLLTNRPQFIGISSYDAQGNRSGGHAIIAYKMKGNEIFTADPNYPGVAGRKISFDEGKNKFKPYSSAANKEELDAGKGKLYAGVNYLALYAMIDDSIIASEYEKLLKDKVGDDLFPSYKIEILEHYNSDTGEKTWKECPEKLELDLEDTAKVHEDFAGKLVLRFECPYSDIYCSRFDGTTEVTNAEISGGDGSVEYIIDLEEGVNDIGFYVQSKPNNKYRYIDFKRINVIYETVDLSGTWQGEMNVTEGGNIIDFIVKWFGEFAVAFAKAFDEDADATEIKANLRNSIEEQLIGQRIPMTIELSKESPDDDVNYNAVVRYQADEGELMAYKTKLKYKSGEIKFSLYDKTSASRFAFTCMLSGNDTLSGEYAVHAWGGLVRNAFSGEWSVTKTEES